MPNLYIPRALDNLVKDKHQRLQTARQTDDDADDYVTEWEALVAMLDDEHAEAFAEQHRRP